MSALSTRQLNCNLDDWQRQKLELFVVLVVYSCCCKSPETMLHFCHWKPIFIYYLCAFWALPQPINSSLLHSNHFKKGRLLLKYYFHFSVYSKLSILSVKLFQTLLTHLHSKYVQQVGKLHSWQELTTSQQIQGTSGSLCSGEMAPSGLARVVLVFVQPHASSWKQLQTPDLSQQLQALKLPGFRKYFHYMPLTFILSLNVDYIRNNVVLLVLNYIQLACWRI